MKNDQSSATWERLQMLRDIRRKWSHSNTTLLLSAEGRFRVKVLKVTFNSGLSIKVSNRIMNGLNKWFKQMRFIFSPYKRSSGQQLLCGCQSLESGSLSGPRPFIVTRWMQHCRHHFLSRHHKSQELGKSVTFYVSHSTKRGKSF